MSVLEIERLVVHRGQQAVLQNVTLRLERPGLYGLIGPNGGGKSTLLSVICGLLPASAGRVEVLEETPRRAAPRLALVPQAATFDRAFPVTLQGLVETALLGPRLFSRPMAGAGKRIADAMAKTGISDLADRPLSALSGGGVAARFDCARAGRGARIAASGRTDRQR
ncbi:ATP-binding cassette domain-containing protein [Aquicoccus sp. SU-CL01552]|uniref:ATP-binding cassette domain-containing protein n=1 Tax=Aquicoccus sp. SU-CL01552 TaxID=3127656 RepID=UPI00310C551A